MKPIDAPHPGPGVGAKLKRAIAAGGIWIILAGLVLAGGFVLTQRAAIRLVGTPAPNTPVHEYSWRVAAVLPISGDGYWRELRRSMQEAAGRYHIGLEFLGLRYSEPDYTADRIASAVAARVDGIVCCADDTPAVIEAIRAAGRAGIPVVTIGEDAPESGRPGFVGPNPFSLGYETGCYLYDYTAPLHIAVVLDSSALPRRSRQAEYLAGLRRAVADRPNLHLSYTVGVEQTVDLDARLAGLLAGDERLGAICCANPRLTLEVAKLLQKHGLKRRIILIGAGLFPETLHLLRQNVVHAAMASYPLAMGGDALTMLADIIAGRSHAAYLDSGVQTIEAKDAEVFLVDFREGWF